MTTTQTATALTEALSSARTESGTTLLLLTEQSPVLLIFLRHFGCSFCRQAISDVAELRFELEARRVRPIFVHLGTPEIAKPYFDYYHLNAVERISNPDASLYRHTAFDLSRRHPLLHFLSPTVWAGWLRGSLRKYGIGMVKQDGHQMPGLFFLRQGVIVRSFRYKTIADQPNYLKLIA